MITYKDFKEEDACIANCLVEHYQGEQKECLEKMLDEKRKDWKDRGFIPQTRNIIKPIINKSGMLLNTPPKLELYVGNQPVTNQTLDDLMYSIDWLEFFQNVDVYTRMLKTTIVLFQQYVPDNVTTSDGVYRFNVQRGDALLPTLLHKGNCVVGTDFTGRIITELAFLTTEDMDMDEMEEGDWTYRYITTDKIQDILVHTTPGGESTETIYNEEANPYGFVPAVVFWDENKPVTGIWNELPEDLLDFQKLYNLHLTDTSFSMQWMKQPQLFTNATIEEEEKGTILYAEDDVPVYRVPKMASNVGGLGTILQTSNDDQGNQPYIKYVGPEPDLQTLETILENMFVYVAKDWAVNIDMQGQGQATSGFQLVVQEIDNLNLKNKRGQYFQAAFRRMYDVLRKLYPELPEGSLLINFAPAALPVNQIEVENIWSQKISEGRASIIDYLMEVQNLTKEEAIKKLNEIRQYSNTQPLTVQP